MPFVDVTVSKPFDLWTIFWDPDCDLQQSCSSIGKNQVPQPSTDTNNIVLKVLYTVAEGMYQNVVALHATDRMLDKDTDLT